MTAQLVLAATWAVVGWASASLTDLDRHHRCVAVLTSPLLGLALTTVTAGLGMALGIGSHIELAGAVSIVVLVVAFRRTSTERRAAWSLGAIATMSAATAASAAIHLVVTPILTFDSYRFIQVGRALEAGELPISNSALADFPIIGLQIQALGAALGAEFVIAAPAAAGLLGALGAGGLIVGSIDPVERPTSTIVAFASVSGAALILVSYMLRLQLGLLNSHLLVAGLLSLGAAVALAPVDAEARGRLVPVSAMALAALAMARTEGPLIVALVTTALVAGDSAPRREWRRLAVIAILPAVIWYARLATGGASGEILSPTRSALMLGALIAPVAVLAIPQLRAARRWLVLLAFAALTAALLGIAVAEPDLFATSAAATIGNLLTTGVWGPVTWLLVPALVVAIAAGPTLDREDSWLLIVLGFVGLVLILGGIREFPFRVGFGDSANRMMIHIVPLVSMFVIAKTLAGARSGGRA